jgi:DNA invertase Pin-like site-specific DNA recombinase
VEAIERECEQAGWELVELVRDRDNGQGLDRPGLAYALRLIVEGRAAGLVVGELARLASSAGEVAALLEWFGDAEAALIALDLDFDSTTMEGGATAETLIAVGAQERERARGAQNGMASNGAGASVVAATQMTLERVSRNGNGAERVDELGPVVTAPVARPVARTSEVGLARGWSGAVGPPRSGRSGSARVLGYVTVSGQNGTCAQVEAIERECERAGWELVELVRDRDNGRGLDRPGLAYALRLIVEGRATGLVVGELARLASSAAEVAALLEWFGDAEAALIALDLGLDSTSAEGRATARALMAVGAEERERARRAHLAGTGSRGRPAVRDRPELAARIAEMRRASMTLQDIADRLNAEGVPTLRGGSMWRPSSVQTATGYKRPANRGSYGKPDPARNGREVGRESA